MRFWLVMLIVVGAAGTGRFTAASEDSYVDEFRQVTGRTQDELRTAQAAKKGQSVTGQILAKEQAGFRSILTRFEAVRDPRTLSNKDLLAVAEVYERRIRFAKTAELAHLVLQRDPANRAAQTMAFRSCLNLGPLEPAELLLRQADEEDAETHPYPRGHAALAVRYEIVKNWPKCRDHLQVAMKHSISRISGNSPALSWLESDLRTLVRCAKSNGTEREVPVLLEPIFKNLSSHATQLGELPTNEATLEEEGAVFATLMRIAIVQDNGSAPSVFNAWLRAADRRLNVPLGREETVAVLRPIAAFAAGNRKWCEIRWKSSDPVIEEFSESVRSNGRASAELDEISDRFLAFISGAAMLPAPGTSLKARAASTALP